MANLASLSFSLTAAVLAVAALPASAQQDFLMDIDPVTSAWSWSGSTDLGPLNPTTTNQFQIDGTTEVTLTPGALALAIGQLTGNGVATVMPDLSGFVPNPLPFLPPLATVDVANLTLTFASDPFALDAAGNFSTMLTVTALSGTVTVVPLVGTPTNSDLAGTMGAPTPVSGTIAHAGGNITLNSPQNSTFSFVDPASGIGGTFTLIGVLKADWLCPSAVTYCTAKVNSLGCTPQISVSGTYPSYSDPSPYDIIGTNLLNLKPGLLFYGLNGRASIPFQGGTLCMVPPLRRTPLIFSGGAPPADCSGVYTFDFNAWTQGGNDPFLEPGLQIQGQFWSRDQASSNGSGLTDAVELTVCP